MSVTAALALVRQVQSVAEQPELLRANNCLDQVVTFLECYLDHPDERCRFSAARTLAQLSTRCGADWEDLDLKRTQRILESCVGTGDQGDATAGKVRQLLQVALRQRDASDDLFVYGSDDIPCAQTGGHTVTLVGRGEIRLQVLVRLDETIRANVLKAVVGVSGVVSVTLEGDHIVVGTRTTALAADQVFIEDIRITVVESLQGQETECGAGPIVVLEVAEDDFMCYLDDEQEDEEDAVYLDDSEDEPQYLDDEDDGELGVAADVELGYWTFFESLGLKNQHLQEFTEDPALIARLRKARSKLEKRQQDEQSRIGRILSVVTPSRVRCAPLSV